METFCRAAGVTQAESAMDPLADLMNVGSWSVIVRRLIAFRFSLSRRRRMRTLGAMKISTSQLLSTGMCLLASIGFQSAWAQNTTNFPTLGNVVRLAPGLDAVLDREAKLEVLSSGFDWAEGPVWVPGETAGEGHLLFSDIPPNQVIKWVEGEGTSVFLEPSGYSGATKYGGEPGSNGLVLDAEGRLVSCEHGDRRLSVLTKEGGKRTLVDNFDGKRLNSPNDATFKSNGDLYFTDPPYGLPNRWEDPRRELDFCGVYRLATDGKLTLLTKEMTRPNGIAFSPDEKTLYVAQSDPLAALWKAFPVKEDGTLGESRVFFDATPMVGKHKGLPDGLKVDSAGNLWATGPGGVHIFSPDGVPIGRIDTGEATANCGWGGDGSVLYITADMYLCRIQTKVKGAGH
ncbi:MAG: gluconolactonase [Verrucomicrobiales bacterium]|jgi:gluconolactonase